MMAPGNNYLVDFDVGCNTVFDACVELGRLGLRLFLILILFLLHLFLMLLLLFPLSYKCNALILTIKQKHSAQQQTLH